jgi:hypothetical protein
LQNILLKDNVAKSQLTALLDSTRRTSAPIQRETVSRSANQ